MISPILSQDIVKYLTQTKGYSVEKVAQMMGVEDSVIAGVLKKKVSLQREHIDKYLAEEGLHFWELAFAAIPKQHLSEKAYKRIMLCKQLSEKIRRKR